MKHSEHPETCPICGRKYLFPLYEYPLQIDGFNVTKPLARGFYSAAYVVKHPYTKMDFLIKIIPVKMYSKEEGYAKEFNTEVDAYRIAYENKMNVPQMIGAGECQIKFRNGVSMNCYYIQMNLIEGPTLSEFKKSNSISSTKIAQITYDLFDFLRKIDRLQLHHNDLHDGNIIIETNTRGIGALNVIDPSVKAYVIDLGSMNKIDRSSPKDNRDITWIVEHTQKMINSYWSEANIRDHKSELIILTGLTGLIGYFSGKETGRELEIDGYCDEIYNIVKWADAPGWRLPKKLVTMSEFYNTQPMEPYYAPYLFYDPEEKWTNAIKETGPMLLTGMRGCGKTLLLKSLHFFAQAEVRKDETTEKRIERLRNEGYLGLFVSASALLSDPKSKELHLPNHKLILAFSLDLVKCLRYCEVDKIGVVSYIEVERFCDTLNELIPWFVKPQNVHDLVSLEFGIEDALFKTRNLKGKEAGELNVYSAFSALATRATSMLDIWNNKHILYLLDDLSTRYLKQSNVDEVLSQLNYQAKSFSFKISTETPSLHLTTAGGKESQIFRDYKDFDLGSEVILRLKNSGVDFIENVIKKRLLLAYGLDNVSPKKLLGSQHYTDVARSLSGKRNLESDEKRGRKRGNYWGIETLCAISTGDIGDSITIFQRMVDKVDISKIKDNVLIPREIQDSVIFDFADRKLRQLMTQKKWYYDHAVSFAQASQTQMIKSYEQLKKIKKGRIRQYSELFLRIDPNVDPETFGKINELVENGVYVYAGGTPRRSGSENAVSYFTKLAFKKILGITNFIPISYADRFELSGNDVKEYIDKPSPKKLNKTVGKDAEVEDVPKDSIWDWSNLPYERSSVNEKRFVQPSLERFSELNELDETVTGRLYTSSELPLDVESSYLRPLRKDDLRGKHIIGALGFEDRSLGTWRNIFSNGRPEKVTMIRYSDHGHAEEILDILKTEGVKTTVLEYTDLVKFSEAAILDRESVKDLAEKIKEKDCVLDITSMTKVLIYLLVSEILKAKGHLGIIHTLAEKYLPSSKQIEEILGFLGKEDPKFFEGARQLVKGEMEPESRMTIWQNRNPGASVFLVCFLSFKYSRVTKLLEELPVDAFDIIYPLSSDGEDSPRSAFAKEMAQILVGNSGQAWSTNSDDHIGAFRKLKELYLEKFLYSGMNFEMGLTGTKMHTVAAGMLGVIANVSGVYYTPVHFDPRNYTIGTGNTTFTELEVKYKKKTN
jgi:serine/threonine protein kinase